MLLLLLLRPKDVEFKQDGKARTDNSGAGSCGEPRHRLIAVVHFSNLAELLCHAEDHRDIKLCVLLNVTIVHLRLCEIACEIMLSGISAFAFRSLRVRDFALYNAGQPRSGRERFKNRMTQHLRSDNVNGIRTWETARTDLREH